MIIKNLFKIAAFCAALPLLTSCAYRADLNQGNYLEQEGVDKLSYGMSSDQVRYVLGTPMLIDPFDNAHWYYTSFKREGWGDPQIKNLVLLFNNNTLVDMSGDFKKPATFGSGNVNLPSQEDVNAFELPQE